MIMSILNQACAWFTEIVYKKYVGVDIYTTVLIYYMHPREQTF